MFGLERTRQIPSKNDLLDSPFSLWATPVRQTTNKLKQPRLYASDDTVLGQELAVDAIDREVCEVTARRGVHGGDDPCSVLSVDVLEERQASLVFLGGRERGAQRTVCCECRGETGARRCVDGGFQGEERVDCL